MSFNYVSITIDIWMSDSNIAFITVMIHFIFECKLHAYDLSTKDIYGSHTGADMVNVLRLIMTIWNVTHKILAEVFDYGANIKNAVSEHIEKLHHPCVSHILYLSKKLSIVLKKSR